ncbi:MAG TPA: hypothetical protein VKE22_26845 [Haliangiales bacterium]|nr:hypothetical protein [Haliangiales bacterium]
MRRLLVAALLVPALAGAAPRKKPKKAAPAAPHPAAAVAPRHSAGIVEDLGDGVIVDWTEGRLAVGAIAPAELRAPNVGVARAGAERVARQWAEARILQAAKRVPAAAGAELRRVDRAREADIEYFSDGSTRVELEIRLAALHPGEAAAPGAPLVVDARGLALRPALGLTLAAGAARYAGPTTFVTDAPPGAATATAAQAGVVTVDVPEAQLAAAAKARAPVVIVVKPMR